jgi:hypothetical protein
MTSTVVDETDEEWAPGQPPPGRAQGGDKANPKPVFADVVSFVNRYVAPATGTRLGGPVAWCPRWWEHPNAVLRLTALWRAWETLRLEPAGMSAWWVGHYDAHMRALLDADRGPFYRCTKAHQSAEALPTVAPPADWRKTSALDL